MQSYRTNSSRRPNSRQRQSRAIVNLRQLSQTHWIQAYDRNTTNQQNSDEKPQHTGESVQLPLNPKNNNENSKRFFLSNLKPRPQTIQHHSLQSSNSRRYQIKPQPMTSINFYESNPNPYRTLNARSRLNQDIQMFASRIKQQGKLIQSFQSGRSKSKGMKDSNDISFKSNVTKKSFFYKQLKDYLYDSFKVDGKPVEIKWDRYSIDSHGLPKKKSVYSFKEQNIDKLKTDLLMKKVQRYQFQQQKKDFSINSSARKKSSSLYDNSALKYAHQTLHVREKNNKNKPKGKLWLGRPPTSLVIQQTES